jgi:Lamin Tail Domain
MPDIYITQALPNPAGKDRPPHGSPSNTQLNSEWLEFQNTSGKDLGLEGVSLLHQTFNSWCQRIGQESVTSFKGTLGAAKSIRVHTGKGEGAWEGPLFHFYLGRSNYVWNNTCGDAAVLAIGGGTIDQAGYSQNPAEGKLLRRVKGTNDLR